MAVPHQLLHVHDSLLVYDVQKLRTDLDVFCSASGGEAALRELVSADPEIQLVPYVWRVAGNAEPTSALGQIGERRKYTLHWRGQLK